MPTKVPYRMAGTKVLCNKDETYFLHSGKHTNLIEQKQLQILYKLKQLVEITKVSHSKNNLDLI